MKIKEANYEAKFSIISILKDKIDKIRFEKNIITKTKKKRIKTLWIAIVIDSVMGVE